MILEDFIGFEGFLMVLEVFYVFLLIWRLSVDFGVFI